MNEIKKKKKKKNEKDKKLQMLRVKTHWECFEISNFYQKQKKFTTR